jgi:hypothetical protein
MKKWKIKLELITIVQENMKIIILIICGLLPAVLYGQPLIENAENFKVGTVLVFQHCETENVQFGNGGANQVWDFSSLKIKKSETTIERMVLPQSTKHGELFPKANLVEEYSDNRLVYMLKTDTENYLLGFVDTTKSLILKYNDPMLFAKRPLKYGDTITDSYTTEYSMKNFDFKGQGTVTIVADGYGKLVLPDNTYENVLRVKITQEQTDILTQYSSVSKTETISYIWFDKTHTSALLKIDETKSTHYNNKSVEYLLSETH